jgi:hypothetical protein
MEFLTKRIVGQAGSLLRVGNPQTNLLIYGVPD